jgi:hypothetical protein
MPVTNLLKVNRIMPAEHPLVQRRRLVCSGCAQRTLGRVMGLLPGQVGAQCRLCSCVIVLKTRCLDERCQLGLW